MALDAQLGLAGMTALVLAAIAWSAERKRLRRTDLDRVGWVPWTSLFFFALLAGIVLLALAIKARAGG